ncbi:MAG: hypothetical protein OEZ13_09110 [Spirochaetia bacterium]|nr:hypothetical protein [Spirochaetia bacterium]
MKIKNRIKKNLKRTGTIALLLGVLTPLFSSLPQDSIKISVYGASAGSLVSLTIVDETDGSLFFYKPFSLEGEIYGTTANGEFMKTINGLNTSHRYTVFVMIDNDKKGGINDTDTGQVIKNIAAGAEIIFDNFSYMGGVQIEAQNDPELSGKTGRCLIGASAYGYSDAAFIDSLQFLSLMFAFYQDNGDAFFQQVFLPAGSYGNILCYIDADNSGTVNAGDYYQIINETVNISGAGEKLKFSLGPWQLVN